MTRDLERVVSVIIDSAIQVHRELGPGLLERVYLTVLAHVLRRRGLVVEKRKKVSFEYDGLVFHGALEIDLLVEGQIVVELKSVERLAPVHFKQVLTYLRLMDLRLGLLINFGGATLKDGGIRRIVNGYHHAKDVGSRQDTKNFASREDAKTRSR